jgi:hypothetical protein
MARLTAQELASHDGEGWVKPAFRLPAARVDAMRQALDELIARNPGVRPGKLVSAHIEGHKGEGVRGSAAFFAQRPLWPVRGVDRSGRNDFGIGHPEPVRVG